MCVSVCFSSFITRGPDFFCLFVITVISEEGKLAETGEGVGRDLIPKKTSVLCM